MSWPGAGSSRTMILATGTVYVAERPIRVCRRLPTP